MKTFAQQAADRLGFLSAELGFTGPETVPDESGPYPPLPRVSFRRADLAAEIILVLSHMGEEHVAAYPATEDATGAVHRAEIGRGTAHTGYQMRRALDLQAKAVRRAVSERTQPSLD